MLAAVPINTSGAAPTVMTSEALYNGLYALGYQNDTNVWQSGFLFGAIASERTVWQIDSVLDVGCSHGKAVDMLWGRGHAAAGTDISSLAIDLAIRTRLGAATQPSHGSCPGPCFQQAPATKLPYASQSFDAVLSSDVLEHLLPDELEQALLEITRVARKAIFVKISNRVEGTNVYTKRLQEQHGSSVPTQLHATVRGPSFWIPKFAAAGWPLHSMLETHSRVLQKHMFICCHYIFRPNGSTINETDLSVMTQSAWWKNANQVESGARRQLQGSSSRAGAGRSASSPSARRQLQGSSSGAGVERNASSRKPTGSSWTWGSISLGSGKPSTHHATAVHPRA